MSQHGSQRHESLGSEFVIEACNWKLAISIKSPGLAESPTCQ